MKTTRRGTVVVLTALMALSSAAACSGNQVGTPASTQGPATDPTRGLIPAPANARVGNPYYPAPEVRSLDGCGGPKSWATAFDVYNDAASMESAAGGQAVPTVVLATVELDASQAADAGADGQVMVRLSDVTVLAGPQIDTSVAWVYGRAHPVDVAYSLPQIGVSFWGSDGRAFGYLTPSTDSGAARPTAWLTPVVDDLLILNDCWWDETTQKYWWHGPLQEVPGTGAIDYFGNTIAAIPLQVVLDASARVRPWSAG